EVRKELTFRRREPDVFAGFVGAVLQAGQPGVDIGSEAGAAILAVAGDVDANVDLFAYDLRDAPLHVLSKPGVVVGRTNRLGLEALQDCWGAHQTSNVSRQDAVSAAFHAVDSLQWVAVDLC